MENILQILQTIGICVSAIALAAITFFMFTLWISFYPRTNDNDEDNEFFNEEDEPIEAHTSRRQKGRPRKR